MRRLNGARGVSVPHNTKKMAVVAILEMKSMKNARGASDPHNTIKNLPVVSILGMRRLKVPEECQFPTIPSRSWQ